MCPISSSLLHRHAFPSTAGSGHAFALRYAVILSGVDRDKPAFALAPGSDRETSGESRARGKDVLVRPGPAEGIQGSFEPRRRVHDLLYEDEVLCWEGAPSLPRGFDGQDIIALFITAWIVACYSEVIYFTPTGSTGILLVRLIPSIVLLLHVGLARPLIRRAQFRVTAFAVTSSRAIVATGEPFGQLQTVALPTPFEVRRRHDHRGSINFSVTSPSTGRRGLDALDLLRRIIAFLLGWRRRVDSRVVFFNIPDVDDVVSVMPAAFPLTHRAKRPATLRDLIESNATSRVRTAMVLIAMVLLLPSLGVLTVRLRTYLDHSPLLSTNRPTSLLLAPNTYVIFEHTARAGPYDCAPKSICATLRPEDVRVVAKSGARVPVTVDASHDGLTRNGLHFAGAVELQIPTRATYLVSLNSNVRASFVLAVEPSEEAVMLSGWIAAGLVGLILLVGAAIASVIARGRSVDYSPVGRPFSPS